MIIKAESFIVNEKEVLGMKITGLMLSLLMLNRCRTEAEYYAESYILVASQFLHLGLSSLLNIFVSSTQRKKEAKTENAK